MTPPAEFLSMLRDHAQGAIGGAVIIVVVLLAAVMFLLSLRD